MIESKQPIKNKTLLYNSNLSKAALKNRLNIFCEKLNKRNISPSLTHIKAALYLMLVKDFSYNHHIIDIIAHPDIKHESFDSIIDHYYRVMLFPKRYECDEYLTLLYGKDYAINRAKAKKEAIKGEKNPGYQHGGKLSPFCKNFIKDDIRKETQEKAKKTRNEHPERQNTKIEYFLLLTNGDMEEAQKIFKERQAVGRLDKYIERFGEEEGKKKWKERQIKWQNTLNAKPLHERREINRKKVWKSGAISNIEKEIYRKIKERLPDVKKQLKVIRTSEPDKWYIYDIYYKNKIIEVNGDYWHGNPNIFSANDIVSCGTPAKDIWKKDEMKHNEIISRGYKVKVLWESEYYKDKDLKINECIKFLLN